MDVYYSVKEFASQVHSLLTCCITRVVYTKMIGYAFVMVFVVLSGSSENPEVIGTDLPKTMYMTVQ